MEVYEMLVPLLKYLNILNLMFFLDLKLHSYSTGLRFCSTNKKIDCTEKYKMIFLKGLWNLFMAHLRIIGLFQFLGICVVSYKSPKKPLRVFHQIVTVK